MTLERRLRAAWQALRSPEAAAGGGPPYWTEDLERIIRSHQAKLPCSDKVMDWLDIRPGMTIVDVGAGTGQQSFRMAQKLQGTGRVFATDMNPRFVEYVAQQARQRGLANLEAVLVHGNLAHADPVDDFYARHRYDLILLYDIVAYICDRRSFYRRLGGLLRPRGRMVVVHNEAVLLSFYREDFEDWEGFLAELEREPARTPFGWVLCRPLRAALAGRSRTDPAVLERAVLFHLNRLLDLPFFMHFLDQDDLQDGLAFTADEKVYADWTLSRLRLAGIPAERHFLSMAMREFRCLQRLNKLLIIQRFRTYLTEQKPGPYESISPENGWHAEEEVLRREFQDAGFCRRHELVPFKGVWVLDGPRSGQP